MNINKVNDPSGSMQAKNRFPLSLLCLTLGAFAIGMTEFIIMGLLPNVASDLGVSIPQAGQLITSYALGVAIGAPILTVFTHKLPQKKLLVILMCIFITGNAVSVIAPTYLLLITARVFTAFAHGTFLGVGTIIAARLVQPDKRAGAVSVVLAGLTVANIIGVPFGTFIGQQLGWRASFGAITVLGIISLFGIIRFIPVIVQQETANLREQVRGLFNPQVLLILLTGALGCGSLFSLFTYITPMLQGITGFAEQSVTWILVLFGVGVTLGNIVGGKLADWKLMPSLMVNFAVLAVVISLLTLTLQHPVMAVINIFLWGIAAFGIMPGIQLRIMNLAHKAPLLATTSSHSALNLGNAAGAYLGGAAIDSFGLTSIPWLSAVLAVMALAGAWFSYVSTRGRASAAAKSDAPAA
ncbi:MULTISPECIES: MFS transporter [unclassified Paenibacillus]|uniref:MFS transporter n=1 Tax=unclassified Paenibacillus TaxID=185978 RepID=UPI002404E45E|nr:MULTISPECIES: MFS transporter [unclassified Paenibacillus]MDF9844841.1 DHA1 family inner membrane transport protein [Paenibacillus sp. PastF-2]MDF9851442.1 DHA1 family inner membrane transport protein [Paenibacillus sp. PastM-2]MDF9858028.1 DHA1 family inner membrane transport protein [Paenibacillus sp. PastF-1]MDH6483296.1 DHA1 family inner membrane transport protein [Paenibacillus sp. PastH-2]MDH6510705.1 DHA1 family inner membrane transport protein [Paenibacillus sp. PastM-3]